MAIYASEDAYCDKLEPNTAHNNSHLYLRYVTGQVWQSVCLKFSLEGVTQPVTSCTLVLPIQEKGAQTYDIDNAFVSRLSSTWSEDTFNYYTTLSFYSGRVDFTIPANGQSVNVDITTLVNQTSSNVLSLYIDLDGSLQSTEHYVDFQPKNAGAGCYIIINGADPIHSSANYGMSVSNVSLNAERRVSWNNGLARQTYADSMYGSNGLETSINLPSGIGATLDHSSYTYTNSMVLAFDLTGISYVTSCKLHLYLIDYLNGFIDHDNLLLRISEYVYDSPAWVNLPTVAKDAYVEVDITSIVRQAVACGRTQLSLKVLSWKPYPTGTFFTFGTIEGGHPAWLEIDDTPANYPGLLLTCNGQNEVTSYNPDYIIYDTENVEVQYITEYDEHDNPTTHSHIGYFHWTLSDLGYAIKTVKLRFYVLSTTRLQGANSYNLCIDCLGAQYDHTVISWNNQPSGDVLSTITVPLDATYPTSKMYEIDLTASIHNTMAYDGLLLKFRGDSAASPNTGSVIVGGRGSEYAPQLVFTLYEPMQIIPNDVVDEANCKAIIRANYDSRTNLAWNANAVKTKDIPDNAMYDCYFQFNLSPLDRVAYSYLSKAVLRFTRLPTEYVSDEAVFMDIYRYAENTDWSYQDYEYEFLVAPARTVCYYELDVTHLLRDSAYDVLEDGHNGNITIHLHNDYYNNHRAEWLTIDDSLPMYIGTAETNMTPYLDLEWDFSGIQYFVDGRNGSDSNDGMTYQTPWRTLTKAATEALPRTTINLFADRVFADEPAGNQIAPVNSPVKWSVYGQLTDYWSYDTININETGTVEKMLDSFECTDSYDGLYDGEYPVEWDDIIAVSCKQDGTQHPVRLFFKLGEASGQVTQATLRIYVARIRWYLPYSGMSDQIQTEFRLLTGADKPSLATDFGMFTKHIAVDAGRTSLFYYNVDVTAMVNANTNTTWFGIELTNVPITDIETRILIPIANHTGYGDCMGANVKPRLILVH